MNAPEDDGRGAAAPRRPPCAAGLVLGLCFVISAISAISASGAVLAAAAPLRLADPERVTAVAPGLTLFERRWGAPSTVSTFTVVAGTEKEQKLADALLARVENLGFAATPLSTRAGYEIRISGFASRAAAETARRRLLAGGVSGAESRQVGHDVSSPGGPFAVQVLEIDPGLVEVEIAHARDAATGLETTRELARRRGALAAVNGGFFRVAGPLAGESEGVLVVGGRLLSEPDRGRAGFAVVADEIGPRFLFDRLRFCGAVELEDGTRLAIDGVNRERRAGELIVFTPEFHRTTLTSPGGREIVLGARGVVDVRSPLGSSVIPATGAVISLAPGVAAPLPRDGERVEIELRLEPQSPDPEGLWNRAAGALGAGPLLLARGERVLRPERESIARVFAEARHPRTAVAARADGTLLLVTVDGRRPEWSVGMSLAELTDLLLALGAVDAVNLDGGGSTTMVVHGETVNRPSDDAGDRANGDAILLFAR